MEQRKELSEQEQKRLLKEYALCQEAAHSLESTIWQTSAAVGIGSTGSFILTAHGQLNWFVAAIAGGMIIAVNCIWWRMARRWWSIQHAHFLRMRHIEDLMALYQVRYVDYLDALRAPTSKETADDLGARLLPARAQVQKDLGEDPTSGLAKRHQREGVQAKLQWLLVVNGAAWILYVMYLFCLWVVTLACWSATLPHPVLPGCRGCDGRLLWMAEMQTGRCKLKTAAPLGRRLMPKARL